MGTEVASTSRRGIYANDEARGRRSAATATSAGRRPPRKVVDLPPRPWVAGGFVWTGPIPRQPTPCWPCISSPASSTCGFPKDLFYYYQAWWAANPCCIFSLELERQEDRTSRCGASRTPIVSTHRQRHEQRARGEANSRRVESALCGRPERRRLRQAKDLVDRRETTGAPAKIVLVPDRARISADGEDLSVVVAQIVDSQGRVVPTAADDVTFTVSGPGRVIGVGNGDPSSHEPDRASRRKAFNGLCMALVQSQKTPGEIRVEASASGLASATATLAAAATPPRPTL